MTSSRFSFLRRVRIHGGECGAVARALHHAVKSSSFYQAEPKKAFGSTIERKQMSTKTTLKRIALVAVSALGFGLMSVVPASAASERDASAVTLGASTPARAGQVTTVSVGMNFAAALVDNDTSTVAAKVLTAPSGSNVKIATASARANTVSAGSAAYNETALGLYFTGNGVATDSVVNTAGNSAAAGITSMGVSAIATNNANTTQAWSGLYLNFIPDVEGTYTILVSNGSTSYTAGDKSVVWTVTTNSAPTVVSLSSLNSTVTANGTCGARIKVTLSNASGATILGPNESLSLSSSDSDVSFTSDCSTAITGLSASDFTTYGYAIFYAETVSVDTAQTAIVTVSGSGLLSSAVSATLTTTHKASTGSPADVVLDGATTTTADTGYAFAADDSFSASPTQTSHVFETTVAADADNARYYAAYIADDDGVITGIAGTQLDVAMYVAAGTGTTASYTASAALGTLTSTTINFYAGIAGTTTDQITITGATPTQDSTVIETPALRSADGASNTMYATTYDQFGIEMANVVVSVSVSGRNTVAAVSKLSDADGRVSITWTDAGTAASSNKIDTVLFDGAAGTDDSETVTYGAYTVGTVTVTGGATADTVAYPATGATTGAISTAVAGAAGATTTFTATVKDASGNVLSGVPVTWSVDKDTAGITKTLTSDSSTCYTGSAGTCTTTVYSWAAPSKVTVTATAGGVSGSGHQNYVNAASDARVLSATVNGNIVTAKVVDRYGNAVSSVAVSAVTAAGYFGAGATSTSGNTGTDGTVGFVLLGNADAASVTVSVSSATYGQTDDAEGKVGTTAVTAAVAGTSTGVGSSLAPAGVNSVTVSVGASTANAAAEAASDAALEAIDAANAATDAANLAAEAADAATVAAEEARDAADAATAAVEALASEVATLMAALKAQITTLAKTVAKIAKKVKA